MHQSAFGTCVAASIQKPKLIYEHENIVKVKHYQSREVNLAFQILEPKLRDHELQKYHQFDTT